jgi:hypothetical protein
VRPLRVVRARVAVTALAGAALLVPLIAVTTPAASAACATRTTRSISGTVIGTDNLDVNVTIGFDVESSTGVIIDATPGSSTYGCKKTGGYSVKQLEKNRYINAEGKPANSPMYDYKGTYMGRTSRTWTLSNLPSNATSVWIEVYSRRYRNTGCLDGSGQPCAGISDTHKYGYAMRRKVAVGATGVIIKLPRNCSYTGGSNGVVAGSVKSKSGQSLTPSRAMAWSTAADSNTTTLGWGSGVLASGSYKISALASKQTYAVWVTYNGVTQKRTGITVNTCRSTPLNFVF